MSSDLMTFLDTLLIELDGLDHIKAGEIPNIDLYMDQVTTFMDSRLRHMSRCPGEDKVMTKTMINNYAKNELLPPPVKKKYSKEHVLLLLFIYYFKGFLSINDIQTLLKPVKERYFQSEGQFNLEELYEKVFSMEREQMAILKQDVSEKYAAAETVAQDLPEEEREFFHKFAFICLLSFDVYLKKAIIEKLIDGITPEDNQKEEVK